jgi:DNA-binding MarR family transcriptional regulator
MDRNSLHREVTVYLFQASNALQAYLDQLLTDVSLTAKQFFLLIVIGSFEQDPNLGELASRFGTSHQNVRQLLGKLRDRDFVRLYPDASDARILRIGFTEKTARFWQERNERDARSMEELFAPLSDDTLRAMRDGILTTLGHIQALRTKQKQDIKGDNE